MNKSALGFLGSVAIAAALLAQSNGARKEPSALEAAEQPAAVRPPSVSTYLMFEGKAEEAMTLYTSTIRNSRIVSMQKYGAGGPGKEGSVYFATFTLDGVPFSCFDSPAAHPFTFTPSISLLITCKDEAEIDAYAAALGKDGEVFMPMGPYPFAKKFVWLADRFGVSWQLMLPLE